MRVTLDLYQMSKKTGFSRGDNGVKGENEWVSEREREGGSVGGVMAVKWKTQKEKGKRYSPISGDDFAGQPSKHFKIENVNWAWWEKERGREKKKGECEEDDGGRVNLAVDELLDLNLKLDTQWVSQRCRSILISRSALLHSLLDPSHLLLSHLFLPLLLSFASHHLISFPFHVISSSLISSSSSVSHLISFCLLLSLVFSLLLS